MSIDPPPYHPAAAGSPAPVPPSYPPPPGWQPVYGAQPGPGWGSPTAFPPSAYPPAPARKPAPTKLWYVLAAVLIVVGLVICGVGIAMMVDSIDKQPPSEHTFGTGGSVTMHLDAGETKVVYLANATAAGGHRVNCVTIGGERGDVDLKRYQGSLTINQWDATFTLTPRKSGDYTIRCTGAPTDTFGIGEDPGLATIFAGVLASIGGAFLLVVGLAVVTVTAVLRRRRSA